MGSYDVDRSASFRTAGMGERAEGLGGQLQIDSSPGRGTRVVAMVPGGGA